jgi:mRNA interferase MazF
MKAKQFEIWLADLSPRFGTEAGKTRPVLIVQSDLINGVHPSTVICPLTTNVLAGTRLLRLNLPEGAGGLRENSAVMIDQVRAIDNKRLLKRIGHLPVSLQQRLKDNLRVVLDLE